MHGDLTADVLVRPLRVHVLHIELDVLAARTEERIRDDESVAVGVLGACRRLLIDAVHPQRLERVVARDAVVAQPVQRAVAAAEELTGAGAEVDPELLDTARAGFLVRDCCCSDRAGSRDAEGRDPDNPLAHITFTPSGVT